MIAEYHVFKHTSESWNMCSFHFHEEYEILLSLSENADFFVTDQRYPLHYGSLILLKPTLLHRSVAPESQNYNRFVLQFSEQYAKSLSTSRTNLLNCFLGSRCHYQLRPAQAESLCARYRACIEEKRGFGADLSRNIDFMELLLDVNSLTSGMDTEAPATIKHFQGVIREMLTYISANLTENLSLTALSERFYVSVPHMCRIFKEATGFTLGEYIVKSRIMRARVLLQEGRSVQDAGEESGFRNYAHFIRAFHQMVGVTPGKYKNQHSAATE